MWVGATGVSRPAKESPDVGNSSHRCGAGLGLVGGEAEGGVTGDTTIAA